MNETERIADQLRRAFSGPAWHGPSLREVLAGVSAEEACEKPLPHGHSIWEIVLHLVTAEDVIVRRLGGEAADATPEEDWPPVRKMGPKGWRCTVRALEKNHTAILSRVAALAPEDLDRPIVPGYSSVYATLHGHVQHVLYHAGQIAVLKVR